MFFSAAGGHFMDTKKLIAKDLLSIGAVFLIYGQQADTYGT